MKAFYDALQEVEKSANERIAKLSIVFQADLEDVRKNQTFSDWEWWMW
jgi:hypothetical protein